MKATIVAVLSLIAVSAASSANETTGGEKMDLSNAAPALATYRKNVVLGDLWKRQQLNPRDRSIVTISALVARHHLTELPFYIDAALENGVKPSEITEIMTHLAFYSGWANALDAVAVKQKAFAAKGIQDEGRSGAQQLSLNEEAEAKRAEGVNSQFGDISPGLVKYTTEVLFRDLWLRPELAARDRSPVTVSALIASGQVAQIPYHLNRAMDNGLTSDQAGEVVSHLAFYIGWPNAFSAVSVVKDVVTKRPK